MSVIHWLLEPGTTRLAVAILWAFVALIVGCCYVGFKPPKQPGPSLEQNIQRLEIECGITPVPSTRAVTSNRKSGRTVRHG